MFSKANKDYILWVAILEKVWATLHGSYERIVNGDARSVLRDITGAPTYEYEFKEPGLFEMLL